jgi:hypothetical protein
MICDAPSSFGFLRSGNSWVKLFSIIILYCRGINDNEIHNSVVNYGGKKKKFKKNNTIVQVFQKGVEYEPLFWRKQI